MKAALFLSARGASTGVFAWFLCDLVDSGPDDDLATRIGTPREV